MTPKAFDFGGEPEPAPDPAVPRAFDFGNTQDAAAPPASAGPPKALSFDDLPPAPARSSLTAKTPAKALFESEDHPAVRDALEIARADHPALFAQSEGRL